MITNRTIKRLPAILISVLILMMACVDPYNPAAIKSNPNQLVIDGFLNGSDGTASVTLTHAIPIAENAVVPAEKGASVTVENTGGQSFALTETIDGVYTANNITYDETKPYRVRIKTSSGANYSSDYVALQRSPPLDSITWHGDNQGTGELKGIQFYANGHDPNRKTTYYRYIFTETWEYRVTFTSYFKKVGGTPVLRDPIKDDVFTCWRSTDNTGILTVSTKNLSDDAVRGFKLNFVPAGDRKFSRSYSIIVQQRAISQNEFEYWDLIRKTTESLGGLFDPLPSQAVGNVHNDDNASEVVLGYFTGGFVQEQRIFIKFLDLPTELQFVTPYDFACETRTIPYDQPDLSGSDVLLTTIGIPPTAWSVGTPNCSDCRSLGGDNVKPSFMP